MTNEKFIGFTMEKTKHIALVAHDGKKKELVEWCDRNKDVLKNHFLCGTGTTAKLIAEKTGLPVKGFLWDPLEAQPHDPDVRALLRIAVVYDIPVANNLATADFLLTSKFMDETYERRVENFNVTIQERVKAFQK